MLTKPGLAMIRPSSDKHERAGDIVVFDGESLTTTHGYNTETVNMTPCIVDIDIQPVTGILMVVMSDGSTKNLSGLITAPILSGMEIKYPNNRGKRGNKGQQGANGRDGLTGLTGFRGQKGDVGDIGDVGDTGPEGYKGKTGDKGDQGPKGERGDQGQKGDVGDIGDQGKKGERGDVGTVGASGRRGRRGKKGPKGDRGPKGDKGPQGDKGLTGIQGPQGKQGTQGCDGDDGKDAAPCANGKDGEDGKVQELVAGDGITITDKGNGIFELSCCSTPQQATTTANTLATSVTTTKSSVSFPRCENAKPCPDVIVETKVYKPGEMYTYKATGVPSVWNTNVSGQMEKARTIHTYIPFDVTESLKKIPASSGIEVFVKLANPVFRSNPPKEYKVNGLSYYETSAAFGICSGPCVHYVQPCGVFGFTYNYTFHMQQVRQKKEKDYFKVDGYAAMSKELAYANQDKKFWLCMTTILYIQGTKDPNTGTDLYANNPVPGTVLCDITMDIRAS